ncbi:MAG TPA: hypothetical protein ENI08_01655, partial [Candidatus Dependentiae bacterium]|nr:hypothetical protein [Candidatus Dependentiae bacterium]
MASRIKKKIYLFVFLLINVAPFLYGIKRSASCSDMKSNKPNSEQLQQFKHSNKYRTGLKDGLYMAVDLDHKGKVKSSLPIENPIAMPSKAVRVLFDQDYKKEESLLVPNILPKPILLWRQLL